MTNPSKSNARGKIRACVPPIGVRTIQNRVGISKCLLVMLACTSWLICVNQQLNKILLSVERGEGLRGYFCI